MSELQTAIDNAQSNNLYIPLPILAAARLVADAQTIVDEQAEDEGLWFHAITAPEAYLQQELRRLHAAIEATPSGATGVTDGLLKHHHDCDEKGCFPAFTPPGDPQ